MNLKNVSEILAEMAADMAGHFAVPEVEVKKTEDGFIMFFQDGQGSFEIKISEL